MSVGDVNFGVTIDVPILGLVVGEVLGLVVGEALFLLQNVTVA